MNIIDTNDVYNMSNYGRNGIYFNCADNTLYSYYNDLVTWIGHISDTNIVQLIRNNDI